MNNFLIAITLVGIWICLAVLGFRRGMQLDKDARQVSRNKNRRLISSEEIPKKLREYLEPLKALIAQFKFKELCFFDNEYMFPGNRGSTSAVFLSEDQQTVLSFSCLVFPKIFWVPLGLGAKFPIVLPPLKLFATQILAMSTSTSYQNGAVCSVLNMDTCGSEWWPQEYYVSSVPPSASVADLLSAHQKATDAALVKHSSSPIKFASVDQYLRDSDRIQERLAAFSEAKMQALQDTTA